MRAREKSREEGGRGMEMALLEAARKGDSSQVESNLKELLDAEGSRKVPSPGDAEEGEGEWVLLWSKSGKGGLARPLGERVDGSAEGFEKLFARPRCACSSPLRQHRRTHTPPAAREGTQGAASPLQRAAFSQGAAEVRQEVRVRRSGRLVQSVSIAPVGLKVSLEAEAWGNGERTELKFIGGEISLLNGLITLPYPVPLRLLGRESMGWLQVEYLSPDSDVRVCLGNKGTLFVFGRPHP